jgi:hypothetical protein
MLEQSILASSGASPISQAEVANALRELRHDICPHVRLNDLWIPTLYDPEYAYMETTFDKFGCFRSIYSKQFQSPQCAFCSLTLRFRVRKFAGSNSQEILYLRARRGFVPSYKATDPDWLAQIVKSSKARYLKP